MVFDKLLTHWVSSCVDTNMSALQGQVSGTNKSPTQCDLMQLGNAQERTKNLYAARALPCTHWKLHLAVCEPLSAAF